MKTFYSLAVAFIACILTSCSLFSPVPADSSNKYVLNSLPSVSTKKSHRPITLMVAEPNTASFFDTTLIAYSVQRWQLAYFSKNTWASKPSEMLQPLMVQSLQNTHYFHAVISPSVSGAYDVILNTQIEQLVQDYSCCTPLVRLTVRAQIVRASTNRIIATKQFVVTQPILQKSPYAGILAANQATEEWLRQLTQFCLKHT